MQRKMSDKEWSSSLNLCVEGQNDIQRGIMKEMGEREKFAGTVNCKISFSFFLMELAYFCVNLEQIHLS